MSQKLNRSYSVNQSIGRDTNPSLPRSVSYNVPRSNESQYSTPNSADAMKNAKEIKNCLLDGKVQMDKFVKEYPENWDLWCTTVVLRYRDVEKRLPRIAAQLDKYKLESLLLAKNMLQTMSGNLVTSLKPSAQKSSLLSSYLARAEHATANAMVVCVNGYQDFHFEKPEQKDLYSSTDIMSAAMILQRYFTDVINEFSDVVYSLS